MKRPKAMLPDVAADSPREKAKRRGVELAIDATFLPPTITPRDLGPAMLPEEDWRVVANEG